MQEQGVHLLERELKGLRTRGAETRLLVTTVFSTTSLAALALAADLGVAVRVLNPGAGSTYHPKLYLGQHGQEARGVIGSANLTGDLVTNLEAAVALDGMADDPSLAAAWNWAETLWRDPRARPWQPPADAAPTPVAPSVGPLAWAAGRSRGIMGIMRSSVSRARSRCVPAVRIG